MKRSVIGLVTSFALATSLVAAQGTGQGQQQQTPPPTQQQQTTPPATPQTPAAQKAPEVSVVGCVVQGSGPAVFILENAKTNPDDKAEKGKTYVLAIASAPDVDFKKHLNHEVKITGVAEAKTPAEPPAGQKVAEKDLPRFTPKAGSTVTMVADRCEPASR